MLPTPMPPYFLVKISKELQKQRREKVGSLFLSTDVSMTRNMEHGEIVAIGTKAHEYFPEAKIGHTLLMHHFVEGERGKDNSEHLIHEDETYNYYLATAYEWNGRRNESYGVWDGEKIIPNRDFIFLEMDQQPDSDLDLESIAKEVGFTVATPMTTTGSGIALFKEWQETPEQKQRKASELTKEVKELSKSTMTAEIRRGMEEKEREAEKVTRSINAKAFIYRKVAFYNRELISIYFRDLKRISKDDFVIVLNIAANTQLEFMGHTYNVVQTKYVAGIEKSAPEGTPISEKIFLTA